MITERWVRIAHHRRRSNGARRWTGVGAGSHSATATAGRGPARDGKGAERGDELLDDEVGLDVPRSRWSRRRRRPHDLLVEQVVENSGVNWCALRRSRRPAPQLELLVEAV
jgi:hypothetical protein